MNKSAETAHTPAVSAAAQHDVSPMYAQTEQDGESSLLSQLAIQCKLSVGAPDDPLEQEADNMADTVMRMPEPSFIQRKCAHCEEEEQAQRKPLTSFIQKKATESSSSPVSETVSSGIQSSQGGGSPMPSPTQHFMESRFGADFSGVRIHAGEQAAQLSQSLNAQAFTVGNDIYFNNGQYAPESTQGKHLLAHELTHTLQQGDIARKPLIQRRFRPSELMPPSGTAPGNPITTAPDSFFFRGSTTNTTQRRALVIAGIHQGERSAGHLGQEALAELNSTFHPDFHTLFITANPVPATAGYNRSGGSGTTHVDDLNREFGTGYVSRNPIASLITEAVNEFDPERILSIHAISTTSQGGVFLDPIHNRTVSGTGTGVADDIRSYPPVATSGQRSRAFTCDSRNLAAMELTERMIRATIGRGGAGSSPGNTPTTSLPASMYPPASAGGTSTSSSPFSLIYPIQSEATSVVAGRGTSLGTWASGYGRTVVTIEVPGYEAGPSVYRPYLDGIHQFLLMPAPAAATGAATTTGDDFTIADLIDGIAYIIREFIRVIGHANLTPAPMEREAPPERLPRGCTTFADQAALDVQKAVWASRIAALPVPDTIGWIIGTGTPPRAAMQEARRQVECMTRALELAAARTGSGITLPRGGATIESPRRDFNAQRDIWNGKFNFTRRTPFDRITDHARTVCGTLLLPTETRWDTRNPRHRVAWGKDAPSTTTPMPTGARALTVDERQQEILQASSAPGISRHHWGTDFDIIDPDMNPAEWEGTGSFTDEYSWLQRNASTYGFLQSFTLGSSFLRNGYIEERWHWSYYPISQALLEFASGHQTEIESSLCSLWAMEPQFSFIRGHWREFMFNVNSTPVF